MEKCKKALLLCLCDPSRNPRPRRAFALISSMGYMVDVGSHAIEGMLSPRRFFEIPSGKVPIEKKFMKGWALLALRCGRPAFLVERIIPFWFRLEGVAKEMARESYDLIIVEDLFFLPLVIQHKKQAKVLFDAREYYPRQKEHSLLFNIFEKPVRTQICRQYLTRCDQVLTVSGGLAGEYRQEFGIEAKLIRSTPDYDRAAVPVPVRGNTIKMVHHGAAKKNRRIEDMINVFAHLDERFTLDLYLTGNPGYVQSLQQYAKKFRNVHFRAPVRYEEILPMLKNYDIGLYLLKPTGFNTTHCLPNKLFEFIQARLMVAIGPSPEMAAIVREYECGLIADGFAPRDMAEKLNSITRDQIMAYKMNSHKAAGELNWQKEGRKLLDIIQSL